MTSAVPYDPNGPLEDNPFAELPSAVAEYSHIHPPEDDNEDSLEEETREEREDVRNHETNSQTTKASGTSAAGSKPATPIHEQPKKSMYDVATILPERKLEKKYSLMVRVTGLERFGSLSNKKENPTINFDCSSNIPTFRKKNHRNIRKSIQEFRLLVKYLNNSIPESFIPSLPSPYTNYGIGNEEDHDTTIRSFQVWFNRICSNPLILRNEELAFFIESDFNTYTPVNKVTLQVSGLKRKTLKQLAPPYDEVIELAEFRPMVKSIYLLVQDIQDKLLKSSKSRRLLVQDENEFGQRFANLDNDNENKLYKRYGRVMTAVGDINSIIATMDMATFYDGMEWIVTDTYMAKEALTNRHFIMRDLTQAQQNSKNKQEQARKLRSKRDTNPLKVEEALRNLKVATKNEQDLTLKLQRVTCNMLIERDQWISWYESWLIKSVKAYILRRIEYERKKLSLLERVRSEFRKADRKGGLSRLGRDNVSNKSDAVSQSINGDSWTGDVRRRCQQQVDRVSHTEFDNSLTIENRSHDNTTRDSNETDNTLTPKNKKTSDVLDARNAAHMLGITTYNGR